MPVYDDLILRKINFSAKLDNILLFCAELVLCLNNGILSVKLLRKRKI